MTILNLMVGGPAFNSKKISKGDEVCAIDGVNNLKGPQITAALKGSNIAGTKVTLTIKRRLTGALLTKLGDSIIYIYLNSKTWIVTVLFNITYVHFIILQQRII